MNSDENQMVRLANGATAWQPCMVGSDQIGNSTNIGALSHIGKNVVIGENCRIQGSVYIADGCKIGNDVFIGPNSTILNDKYPPSGDKNKWKPVQIHNDAIIGGGCTILPGAHLGTGAVLGGGSVLTKPIPAGEVWAGNPAEFQMTREAYNTKR